MSSYCKNLWEKYQACAEAESQTQAAFDESAKSGKFDGISESIADLSGKLSVLEAAWQDRFVIFPGLPSNREVFRDDYDCIRLFIEKNGLDDNVCNYVRLENGKVKSVEFAFFNDIVDISPLGGLKNLEQLNLNHCKKIKDFSPIAKLKKLRILAVEGTEFSDLSSVKHLDELRMLIVSKTSVRDLSPILDNKNLIAIHLEGTPALSSPDQEANIQKLRARPETNVYTD